MRRGALRALRLALRGRLCHLLRDERRYGGGDILPLQPLAQVRPGDICWVLHSSLTSDTDVDKRTRSAAAAFGALRGVLCNFALKEALRGRVYSVPVLTALLYGSECDASVRVPSPSFEASTTGAAVPCVGLPWGIQDVAAYPRSSYTGASVSPLWNSTNAVVCPAERATCRACPWTGFHGSCLKVPSRTPS